MDQILTLLIGIVVAAGIFAATLFSAAQAYMRDGRLRSAHLAAALLTIAGMGAMSLELWIVAQLIGPLLAIAASAALVLERGWNRLLPVFHILFGLALAARIPFGG
ncbi:MAG: hypothetical protein AAFV96_05840 [Pseudomonadota bacterium]